ncbi:MAG TPA: serine protease [Thermoanaerobaculia bacterium]|nr:serine protease [Thermoanaerobaculia bacterium]
MKYVAISLLLFAAPFNAAAAVTTTLVKAFSTPANVNRIEREMAVRFANQKYRNRQESVDPDLRELSDEELSELHTIIFHTHTVYGHFDIVPVMRALQQQVQTNSKSVAAIVYKQLLITDPKTGEIHVQAPTLEALGVCPVKDSFTSEPAAATCSGFLVRSDVILTASHCIESPVLGLLRFVFDYLPDNRGGITLSAGSIFEADSVVDRLDSKIGPEWVLVKLKRDTGRTPLTPASTRVAKGDPVSVIGCPGGGTLRSADNATVRDASPSGTFVANLDVFAGNSGSPVFDASGKNVVGILTRGEGDWVDDLSKHCSAMKICPDDQCLGETVTRISVVPIPK